MKKKQLIFIFLALFTGLTIKAGAQDHTNAFITLWDTQYMDNGTLTIPYIGTNYDYYWEKVDDEVNTNSFYYQTNSNDLNTTIAANSGVYKVYIKGSYGSIWVGGTPNAAKALTAVTSWGNIQWSNMNGAFAYCSNLSSLPITAPNLSNEADISSMFYGATAFNQNIGSWQLKTGVNMGNMLNNSGLSPLNYGLSLKGWAENPNTPNNINLGAAGLKYTDGAQTYRNKLITDKGWTITDAGLDATALDHVEAFITLWDTQYMGIETGLAIPSEGTNYQYYWEKVGDESTINSGGYQTNSGNLSLTTIAAKSGVYKVYIKGSYTRIIMGNNNNAAKALTTVTSWGNIQWGSLNRAFTHCSNLSSLPTTAPNLSNVTNMSYMFYNASAFNQNIGNWNVSEVTNMSYMFYNASAFNQNIGNWNVSEVTDMSFMFSGAAAFNQNIGNWNVSGVTNMSQMFYGATAFNQNIGNWNVSEVTDMSNMFRNAISFNQNIGNWQLNAGVSMGNMLNNSGLSTLNYGLSLKGWAENPNMPITRNLGAAGLKYTAGAQTYRNKLTADKGWTITDAGLDNTALDHVEAFITLWDAQYMDNGTTLTIPSEGTNYQYYWEKVGEESTVNSGTYQTNSNNLSTTIAANSGVYKVYIKGSYSNIIMGSSPNSAKALKSVTNWGDIQWSSMNTAFANCSNLISLPTTAPNLSNVTDMTSMFFEAMAFNQNIGNWNVSGVNYMYQMFYGATAFNQDIGNWDVSNVADMSNMFRGATAFNQDIGNWDVSGVINMAIMFFQATAFNQNIGNWDVSGVTNMAYMFREATAFNQNIGNWQLKPSINMVDMLNNSGLSSLNYGLSLKGWAENPNIPITRNLGAAGLKYTAGDKQYRDILTGTKQWTINGDAMEGTLPVNLLSFTATTDGNYANLQWQTAAETNNKGFIIYRSGDDKQFVQLGEIAASQISNLPSYSYTYSDKTPLNGNNYYQLVQVDLDGKTTELGVKTLNFGLPASDFRLFPNPTTNQVTASFTVGRFTRLQAVDLTGKVLQNIVVGTTEDSKTISLGQYPSGTYIIRLSGKGVSQTYKVFKAL